MRVYKLYLLTYLLTSFRSWSSHLFRERPGGRRHVRSRNRLSDTLMWSWRAMFAGVSSSSRATSPNTRICLAQLNTKTTLHIFYVLVYLRFRSGRLWNRTWHPDASRTLSKRVLNWLTVLTSTTPCTIKRNPDIFSYNFSKNCQILTIFGKCINKRLGNHKTVYFPTSGKQCLCTSLWNRKTQKSRLFTLMM